MLIVMEGGRPSGVAFVEFPTPQEATTALTKNRQTMGTRYVEIFAANRSDLERCEARNGSLDFSWLQTRFTHAH